MPIPAVGEHAREWSEKKRRDLPRETGDAEEQRRVGEPVDEPAHGDSLHPGADERDALPREKEAKVARAKRAHRKGETRSRGALGRRVRRVVHDEGLSSGNDFTIYVYNATYSMPAVVGGLGVGECRSITAL